MKKEYRIFKVDDPGHWYSSNDPMNAVSALYRFHATDETHIVKICETDDGNVISLNIDKPSNFIKEVAMEDYRQACEEIAIQCEEEGYPTYGSNYELRCESLWDEYYRPMIED